MTPFSERIALHGSVVGGRRGTVGGQSTPAHDRRQRRHSAEVHTTLPLFDEPYLGKAPLSSSRS